MCRECQMTLFVDCNKPLIKKLENHVQSKELLNMETEFCSVALDIIGRAVFNYDFQSVTTESPVVKAVYRALQEAEHRSTSFIPYWNLPFARHYMANLKDFENNMEFIYSGILKQNRLLADQAMNFNYEWCRHWYRGEDDHGEGQQAGCG